MSVPPTVQVGPLTYSITFDNEMSDATDSWGRIVHAKQTIVLDSRQAADHLGVTLLHEVVHAIFKIAGFPTENQEDYVTRLSPLLLDTLRRNPDLVAYLLGSA